MNDKEYRTQKKRIKKIIHKWHEKLGMGWYKVEYVYDRDKKRDANANYVVNNSGCDVVADCSCDFWYGWAVITFYLPVVADRTDEELEEDLLHEYMHVFLKPMQTNKTYKEEELVATRLARAFIWSLK